MINWDDYKRKIIAMDAEGLSSSEIASILSKSHEEISETQDRSVRAALQRWRETGDIATPAKKPAKVLLFDIETAPLIAYLWNRFQKYVPDKQVVEDWYVINWAAKWLFEDEIITGVVTPEESKNRDDKRIVKKLWDLLNEADIVISHNGDKFDIKMMNGRFFKQGLNLPMPYKSIDTFKAARKRLKLESLGLGKIAKDLGVKQKSDTTFNDWIQCMNGDPKALKKMDEYCQQDVRVLEDVYLKLRPFIQPHPNLGLFIENSDTQMCPACASTHLKKEGVYQTTVNLYDAYRCQDCGSITRARKTNISKEHKENITSSTPR